ncbi:MAG: Long-chain-fatty-acid--CoA ligase FadD15 [Myxococcota bacterium]|nr:Long-chain-fatty-acid--CoA ligase FadD15 [Myxococcota bacterium]
MNFISAILANLQRNAAAPVFFEFHGQRSEPYGGQQILDWIARARQGFAGRKLHPGDRIALLAPNSAMWAAADLAIMASGHICVPLYSRQAPAELAAMLRDCEPRLLICAGRNEEDAIRDHWDGCEIIRFSDLFASQPCDAPPFQHAPETVVTLIYTSGTSGEAKGVPYTCANVDFMLPRVTKAIQETAGTSGENDRMFHYLPFCFAGSRIVLWMQLYRRSPLCLSTDLNNLVQEIGAAQPQYFLNVPALLERVRNGVENKLSERGGAVWYLYRRARGAWFRERRPPENGFDGVLWKIVERIVLPKIRAGISPNLRFLICGSAPLSEDTQHWFSMIGVPVLQVYGLTETTAIVTMDKMGAVEPGKVGRAMDGVQMRTDEQGELLVRGPNIFEGYWKKPDATRAAIEDGWFRTGDQAEIDAAGNLKIIGRLKNLVIPESGHNIAPEPLEQRLKELCPEIEHAVIVGHGKPFLAAIYTKADPAQADLAVERLNSELPHYKRIRKAVRVDEAFTPDNGLLTANQKLKRRAIEQRFANEIAEIYR